MIIISIRVGKVRKHAIPVHIQVTSNHRLLCSVPKLKRSVLGFLPVLSWLPRYSLRDNALGDLTSGISVGIMHLPLGLAYALLAGTPPVYGLYTSFYPTLVYFFFGTSKHISIGPFAVTSLMVGIVTETLAPNSNYMTLNGTNGTAVLDSTALYNDRVRIASSLTVLCGIFQFAMGLLQVGFIATYLSDPLVRGYTTGASIQVVLSQLSNTFGISTLLYTGPLSQIYVNICRKLPLTNIGAVVITLVALVVLITVKELNTCFAKKLPAPIPIELIVIIFATIISYYSNLNGLYKVAVVGQIPKGLLAPRNPDISLWGSVAGSAFSLAIVGYAISISLGKTFGLKYGYKVDSNQELIALGLCNTAGGFFQCHFITPSLARSLLQETTGGKTQVTGIVSAVVLLIIILEIGPLFQQLPKAVLACIIYVNMKGMFMQFSDIPALWKSNKVDLMVWLVTLVSVVLLNLDIGLAVSVGFSILTVIFRTQLPRYSILGQVPGTELYLEMDAYEEVKEIPGIIIFRSSTTIYYTNAELYLDALQEKTGIDVGKLLNQKKKREDKQMRLAKKEEKKAKKEARKLVLHMYYTHISLANIHIHTYCTYMNTVFLRNLLSPSPFIPISGSETGINVNDNKKSTGEGEREMGESSSQNTHTIILDLSRASFIDTVTVKTLRNVCVCVWGVCVVEQLSIAGFFCESIPKSCLFATVHDAVLHNRQTDKEIKEGK
uniref:Solute carrier family 26 member 6 n=1 Tax=Esox lucius TaxID=8010 RepID=A0A3P8ZEF0_ESOLU